MVKADTTRLQQVFWNWPDKCGEIHAAAGADRRGVFEHRGGDALLARITDNGIGIEPGIRPRIFRAFEQGRSSITRQFGGLGLGLAISKRLVERHGGTLAAASEGKNKGATFTLTMPVTQEAPKAAYPVPRLVAAGPQRLMRVLLVEDHRDTVVGDFQAAALGGL